MGYKFFDKRFLVMPDNEDIIGKKVFYGYRLSDLIEEVEDGNSNCTSILTAILDDDCCFKVGNGGQWSLAYCDPNYECKVAYSQGKQIQFKAFSGEWEDVNDKPLWCERNVYRVKPESTETRRFTNRELAKWLADNKGQYTAYANKSYLSTSYKYPLGDDDVLVHECIRIREWDSNEWHEPLVVVKE